MPSPRSPIVLAVLLLCACDDPAQDVAPAQVDGPADTTKPAQAPAKVAGGLAVTPENSSIEFEGSKVTGSHSGGFKVFEGSVKLDGDRPEGAQIDITIDTGSVFADSDRLASHLRNDDFFDVPNHPKATFRSSEIRAGGEGGATHTIVGELSLRGKRNQITFPANVSVDAAKVSASAEFSINRKDFGILYAGKADNLIRDLVVIRLKLELPRG